MSAPKAVPHEYASLTEHDWAALVVGVGLGDWIGLNDLRRMLAHMEQGRVLDWSIGNARWRPGRPKALEPRLTKQGTAAVRWLESIVDDLSDKEVAELRRLQEATVESADKSAFHKLRKRGAVAAQDGSGGRLRYALTELGRAMSLQLAIRDVAKEQG